MRNIVIGVLQSAKVNLDSYFGFNSMARKSFHGRHLRYCWRLPLLKKGGV